MMKHYLFIDFLFIIELLLILLFYYFDISKLLLTQNHNIN